MYLRGSMAELRPGATVGRFRLEREVARGGMGAVWAARDPRAPGRLVAVKTVIAAKSSTMLSQLFVEEARIARAVRHPNLVEMYDAGEEGGVPYLAMEWVEGLTLRALATSPGALPLGVILRICMEACDGLHAVHEARTDDGTPLQIVHRDVSPHNLLVSIAGRVKVIDFGIAKARGRLASETTDGVLRGKIRYMSPEHARGSTLDRRSDIWSLGATLLEVTTGAAPFTADHDVALLVQLLSAEPKVPDDPKLPPTVKRVIERALRRRPEERYPNARAMGTDLEAAIAALGEKVTRRDVAHSVRMRIETARTQAIRLPNFDLDETVDSDDDGAATALFMAPLKRPDRPTEVSNASTLPILNLTSTSTPATLPKSLSPSVPGPGSPSLAKHASSARAKPRASRPRMPSESSFSYSDTAPRIRAEAEPEEELTNIRSIDIVIPPSQPASAAVPIGPLTLTDLMPSAPPLPETVAVEAAAASAEELPNAVPDENSSFTPSSYPPEDSPEVEPLPEDDSVPRVPSSPSVPSEGIRTLEPVLPRTSRRLVPILALSFVAFFVVVAGLVVSVGAREAPVSPPKAKEGPAPEPRGSEDAIAIGAIRKGLPSPPDAGPIGKHKK